MYLYMIVLTNCRKKGEGEDPHTHTPTHYLPKKGKHIITSENDKHENKSC